MPRKGYVYSTDAISEVQHLFVTQAGWAASFCYGLIMARSTFDLDCLIDIFVTGNKDFLVLDSILHPLMAKVKAEKRVA